MTVLFWDIDGTLLTTAKGGMFAWDDAVKEITGRDFQLASMRIPGMTDYQIAVRTLESLGLPRRRRDARAPGAPLRGAAADQPAAQDRPRAAERAADPRSSWPVAATCGRTC